MRLLLTLVTLLLALASPLAAQDYASFAAGGDRGDNALLLELLRGGELGTARQVAAALGHREDPFVGDILERLLADAVGPDKVRRELVLRTLLAAVFDAQRPDLRQRLELNAAGLRELGARLAGLGLPLQREILRLTALAPQLAQTPVLMSFGEDLVELLRVQQGRTRAEQGALLRDYLDAVRAVGDADFTPLVLSILEHTREAQVARAARSTAHALLGQTAER